MEQSAVPSFEQNWLDRKMTLWIGIGLCVLIKIIWFGVPAWSLLGRTLNLFFYTSVLSTLFVALRKSMLRWKMNSSLTLIYLLAPVVMTYLWGFLHFRRFGGLMVQLIFAAIIFIFSMFYLREGTQNKRPIHLLFIPVTTVVIFSVFGMRLIRFRDDTVYVILISILVLFGFYLLLSILVTLFYTGSFGVTIRYWEWILTEPPKMVIRTLFKIDRDKVSCRHCDRIIPLVGTYTCSGCKFTFKGHYFDWCPYCYSRFGYINCECGLSRKRPLLY